MTSGRRRCWVGAVCFTLLLVTLACTLTGPGRSAPDRIAHLPTLTRTPLPTLTPTGMAPPQAVASVGEVAPTATVTSLPVAPTLPPPAPTAAIVAESPGQIDALAENTAAPPPAEATAAPTALPSVEPTATFTPIPQPTDTATVLPTETPPPAPTDTPTATPQDWLFSGVRLYPNPYDDGLLLYGNVVNNTSSGQKLTSVLGTFYDGQNQVIAGPDSGESYWPVNVVAPGVGVPFALAVNTIQDAVNFDLDIVAEPSDQVPRQDFEFSGLEQWIDEDSYCVGGEVKNHGGELHDSLVIFLTLFDDQGNIVSFSYYEELDPTWIEGDDELDFELCADIMGQAVAGHDLQAWGR